MRIASIDIGTNTVLLLVADCQMGQINTVFERQKIIRLGKHVDAERNISEEGITRACEVLKLYQTEAKRLECGKIIACGTSALRDAANRDQVISRFLLESGINVEILSGDEEARWTYLGGRVVMGDRQDRTLLIDIGGGSTEFVLGDHRSIQHKISMNIGAVRMTERFFKNDPVTNEEIEALQNFIHDEFSKNLTPFTDGEFGMLGVAGTVTTLASMAMQLETYNPEKINGFQLTQDRIHRMGMELKSKTIEERKAMVGLEPERADVILAGLLILQEAMTFFGKRSIVVSNYGLRYGLIMRALNKGVL